MVTCPKCNSSMIEEDEEEGTTELHCIPCGYRWNSRSTSKPKPVPRLDVTIKPIKRIHGISSKESRRIYLHSPAGKKAQERYRRSELYRSAHKRHRDTEKYKNTQRRFHEKQELFMFLLYPQKPTCPLNLFRKNQNGTTHYSIERCNFSEGNCKFGCMDLR